MNNETYAFHSHCSSAIYTVIQEQKRFLGKSFVKEHEYLNFNTTENIYGLLMAPYVAYARVFTATSRSWFGKYLLTNYYYYVVPFAEHKYIF